MSFRKKDKFLNLKDESFLLANNKLLYKFIDLILSIITL